MLHDGPFGFQEQKHIKQKKMALLAYQSPKKADQPPEPSKVDNQGFTRGIDYKFKKSSASCYMKDI